MRRTRSEDRYQPRNSSASLYSSLKDIVVQGTDRNDSIDFIQNRVMACIGQSSLLSIGLPQPPEPKVFFTIAFSLERMSRYDDALAVLSKMYQSDIRVLLATARILDKLRKYDRALSVLNHPNFVADPRNLIAKGRILQKTNRHQEAIKIYDELIVRDDVTVKVKQDAILTKARCLEEMRDIDNALQFYEHELLANDPRALNAKIHCLEKKGLEYDPVSPVIRRVINE